MSSMPKLRSIESAEVVKIFTEFFEANDHLKIPGHSLAPDNDPSLLFINSGMAPMKKFFLGQESRLYRAFATCSVVSGRMT